MTIALVLGLQGYKWNLGGPGSHLKRIPFSSVINLHIRRYRISKSWWYEVLSFATLRCCRASGSYTVCCMGRFDRLLQMTQSRMIYTPGRPLILARLDLAIPELQNGAWHGQPTNTKAFLLEISGEGGKMYQLENELDNAVQPCRLHSFRKHTARVRRARLADSETNYGVLLDFHPTPREVYMHATRRLAITV